MTITDKKSSPIRIGIVTVRDAAYHPNRRLLEAARNAGQDGFLIHPYRLWPATRDGRLGLIGEDSTELPNVVLPRQGAQIGDTCLGLLRQFQCMGIPLVNNADAVAAARNKFLTQQMLTAAGLPCLDTIFINNARGFSQSVEQLGGYPVVVKSVSGRQGEDVLRINNIDEARQRALPSLDRRHGLMIQRYLHPDNRQDIRALVIDGQLCCAANLTPTKKEFRSNFHLGGKIQTTTLPESVEQIAVKAAAAVGCDIAGVDLLMDSRNRPFLVEVNYSPGFKGMEAATGLDIAGRIIACAVDRYMEGLNRE
jgi:ribosomal protein S6--L-glutamate ligase